MALIIIFTACELRGSKHGHPLPRNPKPLVPVAVAAAPGTPGAQSVSAGGHVTERAATVGKVGKATGNTKPVVTGASGAKISGAFDAVDVVVGAKVAPGGRVMKGNGVLRGRVFLKSQQKKPTVGCVSTTIRRHVHSTARLLAMVSNTELYTNIHSCAMILFTTV